jgi:hypothetical protein
MMDDFFYAEPNAVPEPHTLLLVGMGFAAMCVVRARRALK